MERSRCTSQIRSDLSKEQIRLIRPNMLQLSRPRSHPSRGSQNYPRLPWFSYSGRACAATVGRAKEKPPTAAFGLPRFDTNLCGGFEHFYALFVAFELFGVIFQLIIMTAELGGTRGILFAVGLNFLQYPVDPRHHRG